MASAQQVFDYIIVGGGTAGLVLANRLTEVAEISVLVIEAGASALDSSASTNVAVYGTYPGPIHPDQNASFLAASGQSALSKVQNLNWDYTTLPQAYAKREVQHLPAGKGIGGSSLINGMVYSRAVNIQLDTWERAGNTGWNWPSLFSYYKKSERFSSPTASQEVGGATYNPPFHGFQGLLNTGFSVSKLAAAGNFYGALNDSYGAHGIPFSADMNGGRMRGFTRIPSTVNTSSGIDVRADAGRSYYYPIISRPNLKLVQNTQATKIIWASQNDAYNNAVATAVEVSTVFGTSLYNASREVIISCGTYASPALLERSGVGNSHILSNLGIEVKVESPGVGENLMDQVSASYTHQLPTDVGDMGPGGYVAYLNFSDVFGSNASSFANTILAALPSYAATIASQNNNSTSAEVMLSLLQLQYNDIFNGQTPLVEVLHHAKGTVLSSEFWGTLPFARGSVHSSSAGLKPPMVNPNYWMLEYDAVTTIRAAQFVRDVFRTDPIQNFVVKELGPGTRALPLNASDTVYEDWLKTNYHTAYHGIGTCIMLPRNKGGVVSNTTLVYGTANVRVVDASIIPFQTNGHTQATVYALAEKSSDIIKQIGGYN